MRPALAVVLLAACLAVASAWLRPAVVQVSPTALARAGEPASAPFRFFAASSFWNRPLPADAPLEADSAAVVQALQHDLEGPVGINTTRYSVPVYSVPANEPLSKVTLVDPWRGPGGDALAAAWEAVPIPGDAVAAAGTDEQLVVWQPSTDRLWEFWKLTRVGGRWRAVWGGAIRDVSSNYGAYGPTAWPGATRWWGATASSLSLVGGLITREDLERGWINHALAIAIPNPRAGVYATPARRTDGRSPEPLSLPEGAHLRLDPDLNLQSLHLPRLTLMLARAAQRYGIIVRDTAKAVVFYAQAPSPAEPNPYQGAASYFEGRTTRELVSTFPWKHLQLLKMQLHEDP